MKANKDPKMFRKVYVERRGMGANFHTNMYQEYNRQCYVLDSVEWKARTEDDLKSAICSLYKMHKNDPLNHAYILLHIQALRNLRNQYGPGNTVECAMQKEAIESIMNKPLDIIDIRDTTVELKKQGFEIMQDGEALYWINEKDIETGYLKGAHGPYKTFEDVLEKIESLKASKVDNVKPNESKTKLSNTIPKKMSKGNPENIKHRDGGIIGTIKSCSDALLKIKRDNSKLAWIKAYEQAGLLRQDGYKVRRSDYFQSQLTDNEQNWILKAAKSAK